MRMSSVMRWRSGLAFVCEEVMIGLLLENEADCLIRQHTEPRGGPPMNRTRWPEPLPRERFRSAAISGRSSTPLLGHSNVGFTPDSGPSLDDAIQRVVGHS